MFAYKTRATAPTYACVAAFAASVSFACSISAVAIDAFASPLAYIVTDQPTALMVSWTWQLTMAWWISFMATFLTSSTSHLVRFASRWKLAPGTQLGMYLTNRPVRTSV